MDKALALLRLAWCILYSMIQKLIKRSSFLVGIAVVGVISTVNNYFTSNYSKESSVFIDHVHADAVPYSWTGYLGDGCGGC